MADKRKKTLDEGVAGEKLRADIYDAINHGEYFDFVVMGRRKGAGCYCTINGILDAIFAETMNMYDLVLIDFDAGLEHFSRGTGSNSDALIIVCDQSKLSFETAERITDIVDELALPYASRYVVAAATTRRTSPCLKSWRGASGSTCSAMWTTTGKSPRSISRARALTASARTIPRSRAQRGW